MADKIMDPFRYNLAYIGYGALGGYAGAWAMARWNAIDGVQPLGRYQIESAVAGGVGNYLWLLVKSDADTRSIWKPILVGVLGEWLYNRFVKNMLVEMNILS